MRPLRPLLPLLPKVLRSPCIFTRGTKSRRNPNVPWGEFPVYNEQHVNDNWKQSARLRAGLPIKLTPSPVDAELKQRLAAKESADKNVRKKKLRFDRPTPFKDAYRYGKTEGAQNVLLVRGVNKNVTKEDFVRAVPSWGSGKQWLLRVIPLRFEHTFEKTDDYLVVFRSKAALLTWRRLVITTQNMSRAFRTGSMMTPDFPPQEGFKIHGVDVNAVVSAATLVPSGRLLRTYHSDALSNSKSAVLKRGGYPQITTPEGEHIPSVMIRVVGVRLNLSDVIQSIKYSGIRRNMAWDVILPDGADNVGINRIAARGAYGTDKEIKQQLKAEEAQEQETKVDEEKLPLVTEVERPRPVNDVQANALKEEGQRWLIPFKTQTDAQQFARIWHCRPLPLPPLDDERFKLSPFARKVMVEDGGKSTKVFAELLW